MLLNVPLAAISRLFKHSKIKQTIQVATHGPVNPQQVATEIHLPYKVAWSTLRDLSNVEYVIREGRNFRVDGEKIRDDQLLLNLRDQRVDLLFRRGHTRRILLYLARFPRASLRKIARDLHVPRMAVKRVMDDLSAAGLIRERCIREELFHEPQDITLLVPRSAHRQAIRHLLDVLGTHNALDPIPGMVLFGRASWGYPSHTLEVAVLTELTRKPSEQIQLAESLVNACENVTYHFGAMFEVFIATMDAWLNQELGLVIAPNPAISKALDGICLHGKLPSRDDLFEMSRKAFPPSEERMIELLEKGYIQSAERNKHVYTEKALQRFREVGRSRLTQMLLSVRDKKVPFISIEPPEAW
jgi:DNA-binding Lrp family transcriptional regulator